MQAGCPVHVDRQRAPESQSQLLLVLCAFGRVPPLSTTPLWMHAGEQALGGSRETEAAGKETEEELEPR